MEIKTKLAEWKKHLFGMANKPLRIGLYLKAVKDGLCNRRGKRVDPAAYSQRLNELRNKNTAKN